MSIGQTGVDGLSYPFIRFIGIIEILGALGIILPQGLDILPILTPLVALCFAVIMVLAAPIHYKRKEYKSVILNVSLLVISLLVACMRFLELANTQ